MIELKEENPKNTISFSILGEPFGKQRPKFARNGQYVKTYTPDKTVNYENFVKYAYIEQANGFKFSDDAQLYVEITAYYAIPKSTSKKKAAEMLSGKIRPTKKPDFDNISKIICDSLNTIAYHDDSAIVEAQVHKFYGENPRVEVIIKEL